MIKKSRREKKTVSIKTLNFFIHFTEKAEMKNQKSKQKEYSVKTSKKADTNTDFDQRENRIKKTNQQFSVMFSEFT